MFSGPRIPHVEAYALDEILNDCNRLMWSTGQPAMDSGGFVRQTSEELFVANPTIADGPSEGMVIEIEPEIEIDGWVGVGGVSKVANLGMGSSHQP
jgi:hypothetical protein